MSFIDHIDWSFLWNRNTPALDTQFGNYWNGEYDKEKLTEFRKYYSIPFVRNYMDYLLDLHDDELYLQRYGMDYSDIRDPRRLSSVNSGSVVYGSAFRMISRNLEDLYRD